ncbi:protein kinase [Lentisphaerota bacterium WC36G]|nr:protein kinase [Lentisphaerae bacterium WC36]
MSYKCLKCGKNLIIAYDALTNRYACSSCREIISGKQLVLGVTIASCVIESRVAECSKYTVFKAFQKNLKRDVLVKVLNLDFTRSKYEREKFIGEIQQLSHFQYPNFIQIYEAGVFNGVYYAIFDYFKGEKLSELLARVGSLSMFNTIDLALKLIDSCEFVTERLVNSNFMNPDNIWISSNDEIKLFELCADENEEKHFSCYNAPEVNINKNIKFSKEQYIYSLGAICYEMFCGTKPFVDELLIKKQQSREPVSLKHLFNNFDEQMSDFIDKMLKIDIAERPKSWQEIRLFFKQSITRLLPKSLNMDDSASVRIYESLAIPSYRSYLRIILLTVFSFSLVIAIALTIALTLKHKKKNYLWTDLATLKDNLEKDYNSKNIAAVKNFIKNNYTNFNKEQQKYVDFILKELTEDQKSCKLISIREKNLMGLAVSLTEIISKENIKSCSIEQLNYLLRALDDLKNHIDIFLKNKKISTLSRKKIINIYEKVQKQRLAIMKVYKAKKSLSSK